MKKAPQLTFFKIIILIIVLNITSAINTSAQLSGTYYIDKNATPDYRHYKSFTDAANDLNGILRTDGGPNSGTIGVGGVSASVTFLVEAGTYTEAPVVITYKNLNMYDIVFKKDPVAPTSPVLIGTGGAGTTDPIIEIICGNAYSIDGLTFTANNNTVEYGIWLFTDLTANTTGSSNNTIKNCTVTLDKTNPNETICILTSLNSNAQNVNQSNNNNIITNNIVTNANIGIDVRGSSGSNDDEDNEVSYNNVSNLENGVYANLKGITLELQENAQVYNNTVENITTSFLRVACCNYDNWGAAGILFRQGCKNIFIHDNIIQNIHTAIASGPTGFTAISAEAQGGNDAYIYNNTITNISGDCNTGSGTVISGIYLDGQSTSATEGMAVYGNNISNLSSAINLAFGIRTFRVTFSIYSNTITNITGAGAGNMGGIIASGIGAIIHDNTITGVTLTSGAGTVAGINCTAGGVVSASIYNNIIGDISVTGTGKVYGIQNTGNTVSQITNNTIGNITGTGTTETYGIFVNSAVAGEPISGNTLSGNLTANTGILYGIYMNVGTGNGSASPSYMYGNTISGTIKGTGTTEVVGIYNKQAGLVYSNTIQDNKISANAGRVSGIRASGSTQVYYNTVGIIQGTTASGGSGPIGVYGIFDSIPNAGLGLIPISYNTVRGISATATTNSNVVIAGIRNDAGSSTGLVSVFSNTIGAGNISLSYSGSGTAEADGILSKECAVYNNTVSNVSTNSGNVYGIYTSASTAGNSTQAIWGNTISSVSSSAATGNVCGINSTPATTTGTPCHVYGNNVSGISCSNTSATTIAVTGILIQNAVNGLVNPTFYGNTVSNVSTNSTIATAQVTGILIGNGAVVTQPNFIYRNKIFNISTASTTTGTAVGLQVAASGTSVTNTIYNNMIYDVRADNSIASTLGGGAVGIYLTQVAGTSKLYFNTVYLNGAGPGAATTTTQVSSALYCATGATLDIENNILANSTVINAGASSFIYAFWYAGSAAPGTITNNLLYAGTSAGGTPTGNYYLYNQNGTKSQAVSAYKTAMTGKGDATKAQTISIALSSFFTSSTSPYDVHLKRAASGPTDATGKGVAISGTVPGDFDGDTRSGSTPSIGSDEFNATGCSVPSTPSAISATTPQCAGTAASSYSVTNAANVLYTWSYPAGMNATITSGLYTSTVTAYINNNVTSGSYIVTVTSSNGCGTSTQKISSGIQINGVSSTGTITATNGGGAICLGSTGWTYTTSAVTGGVTYNWNVTSNLGTITSGQGTNTITVSASSFYPIQGIVTAQAVPATPCSATSSPGPIYSLPVRVLEIPISAPGPVTSINNGGNVTKGQAGVIYSVGNIDESPYSGRGTAQSGLDYVWTIPSGATIVGPTNKNRIVVNYSGSASSGNVSVVLKTTGTCSTSSGNFPVTVSPAFTLSGVTQAATVCAGAAATINVTGLPASRSFTAHYSIAGGPNQSASITSNGSGAASFSAVLASTDNGKLLEITDLTDATGTTYFSSNNSVTLAVIGPPNAPVAIAGVNISDPQFTARWNSVAGATGYFLDVATDNAFSSLVSGYNDRSVGLVTSFVVSGLSAGSTYYYRVRVAGGTCSLTSSNSNTISVTTTGCPAVAGGTVLPVTSVICSGGSQLLTVTGTTGGTIQWQVSTDNSHWSDISGATGTTYAASPTQKSYFRSETLSPTCYNATSNTVTVDISATPAVTITNVTSTTVTITWSPYGSGQYDISWSGAGGTGSAPAITTNTFTIGSLNANSDLLVTVTPVTPSCGGVNATSVNTHTLCAAPTVTNVTSTGMIHGFKVNWTSVSGATSYWVYYRDLATSSAWSFVDTSGTHKSINVLYANHTFAVYVVAKDCPSAGNLGNASTPTNYVTTNPLSACSPAPTVSGSSACPNQIHVDITGTSPPYNLILRRISPSLTAGASYPISTTSVNITVGTQYAGSTWEVFATKYCGATGVSAISNVILVTVKPGCPQLTNVVVSHPTCNGFTVSWNGDDCAGLGISGYQLLIKKTGTSNFLSYPVGTATHTVVGWLPSDNTWNVEVMSVACNGATSALSNPDTIATLHCGRAGDESLQEAAAGNIKESITVYPNPTQGQFWIDVNTTDNGSMVKTELISQLGEVIQTNLGQATGGHLNQVINTPQGLASGIYFVRTSVAGNVYVNRIMISKE